MFVSVAILVTLGLEVTYGCSLLNSREGEECREYCGPHDGVMNSNEERMCLALPKRVVIKCTLVKD